MRSVLFNELKIFNEVMHIYTQIWMRGVKYLMSSDDVSIAGITNNFWVWLSIEKNILFALTNNKTFEKHWLKIRQLNWIVRRVLVYYCHVAV